MSWYKYNPNATKKLFVPPGVNEKIFGNLALIACCILTLAAKKLYNTFGGAAATFINLDIILIYLFVLLEEEHSRYSFQISENLIQIYFHMDFF